MQTLKRIIFLTIFTGLVFQSVHSQQMGSGGRYSKDTSTKSTLTAEQIAEKFLPGVVLIICEDGKGNYSQGSGFFIAPGIILTNAHVVKGMVRGVIVISGKEEKKFLINKIGYFNSENTDLALLVSDEAKGIKTSVLPLAQSNNLRIGETIYVLGNPQGLVGTISQGIVSSGIRKMKNMDLLQFTAPISSGSSGGAVMNSRGEVVGIATASLESGQNLNFAVPASSIEVFLKQFLAYSKDIDYIAVSKIPGSWIAPKFFLSESNTAKENKTVPSPPKGKSQPTLEETTEWLRDRITGTKITKYDPSVKAYGTAKYEALNFSLARCGMYYEQVYSLSDSVFKLKTIYMLDLKLLNSVEVRINILDTNGVWISFAKNFPLKKEKYNGVDKKPYSVETEMTNEIVILAKDEENAERIANAFTRLKEVCGENIKEPF